MRRTLLLLLVLLLVLPLLAGCFGPSGVPLPVDRRMTLQEEFEVLDQASEAEIQARISALDEAIARARETKDRELKAELAHNQILFGYCRERLGEFPAARRAYNEAAKGEYSSIAHFRMAQMAEYLAGQAQTQLDDPDLTYQEHQDAGEILELERKNALSSLERAAHFRMGTNVLLREPAVATLQPGTWQVLDIRHEAHQRLDVYYRDRLIYRIFEYFVRICGGADKNSSYVLAIILLAVLAKLITTPLSAAQFRSMRAMQALQPEIKKLQEKYKDDKQQLARAQMDLFKQHKVNPASSCLPMLIQMPVLIWVYYGIRYFIFRFEGVPFLYLRSLADPDVIAISSMLWPGPLLLLYGVSMFFSQKLMSTPTATPEQQQQQKLMAFMMPVLLVVILKDLPAAFILYWFLQNLLMTGHQYYILRAQREATTPGGQPPAPAGAPEPPAAPAGPPPKAMEKLSQGGKRRKKKKKRR